ncbi:MAG: inositol monophosphatase [Hyphomicrobiales bacterium]|nr:inositol monophosphatase [Hyphomicrobiales bacterium]
MHEHAESLVLEAGQIALGHFQCLSSIPVESKGHLDLVTLADRDVERFLTDGLRRAYPDDGVFGEEGSNHVGTSGRIWVVDPIDGTFNFVRGGNQWAVSVGLFEQGAPSFGILHAPVRKQTLAGGKTVPASMNGAPLTRRQGMDSSRAAVGVGFHPVIPVDDSLAVLRFVLEDAGMAFRCCGSTVISLIDVALGEVDGYVGMGDSSWDLVAAFAILEQVGISSTVDWGKCDLSTKFKYAAGTQEFLAAVEPIIPYGASLEIPSADEIGANMQPAHG